MEHGALAGLKVVDLTRVLAGPLCTMWLGDMGADVIKIERPGSGDDTRSWGPPFAGTESAYFLGVNRNKRSVTLDLSSERGRDLLQQLIVRSDVVVDNFSPRVMGNSLDLHPVTILLALIFWGMLWGIVGMLLAAPITAIARLLLEKLPLTRGVGELLAGRTEALRGG